MKYLLLMLISFCFFNNIECQTSLQDPLTKNTYLTPKKNKESDNTKLISIKNLHKKFIERRNQKNSALEETRNLADKILEKYKNIDNKNITFAFNLYKDLWEFYEDISNHTKAIECLQDYIIIGKTDTNQNTAFLLEAYSLLSNQLLYTGRCDQAIDMVFVPAFSIINNQLNNAKSESEKDFINLSKINMQASYLFCARNLGDGNLQREVLKQSEKLVKENHDEIPKYNIYKSDLLGMMTSTYMRMGDLPKAGIFLDLYDTYMKPVDIIDDILLSFRKLYFYTKTEDEWEFNLEFKNFNSLYNNALKQFPENTEEYFLAIGNMQTALECKGTLYEKLNSNNPEISKVYHKILSMIKGLNYDLHINPLDAYSGLFKYYGNKKQKDSMHYYLDKYKNLAIKLNSLTDIRNAQVYTLESYLVNNQFKEAETLLKDYLNQFKIKDIQQTLQNRNDIKNILADRLTIERLIKIANMLRKYKSVDSEYLNLKSNHLYLLGASLLNELKFNQGFNPHEINLLKEINEGILATRDKSLKNDDLIIMLLEGNQSLEMLQKNANKNIRIEKDNDLKKIINQREKLSRKLLKITKQYLSEKVKTNISENETYLELVNSRDNLSNQIKQKYPKYVFYTSPDFDLDAYRNSLDKTSTTLRFYNTDKHCYAYLISKSELKYYNLGARQSFKNSIDVFTNQITNQEDLSLTIVSLNKLLKPVLDDVKQYKNLKIIPHGELSFIPFEILFNDYSKNDIALSYNSSLTLDITRNKQIDVKRDENSFAIYAPKYNREISNASIISNIERSGDYELPDAFEEAMFISKLFDGNLFSDDKASKQHFIKNAKDYAVLHLAMHATVGNSISNEDTMLLFSGNKNEDYLNINNVYDLQLSSELVTLSACNTAYGEIDPIEGVLSLSRAFQYAGSKSTLTSLWRVPDKQTARIMKQFYINLKNGNSKSKALKNAKLDYLNTTEDPNLKHPYYWAGFVLTGDASAIVSPPNYWIYFGLVIILVLIIGVLIKKHLKTNA